MSKYWSKKLRGLSPYVPGEQPRDMKYIKLNTNENPYPPSPAVLERISSSGERLNLYPDFSAMKLRNTIADYYGLKPENIFAGNGSDEILAFCFRAFFDSSPAPEPTPEPEKIIFPEVTYSFYPSYAKLFDINYNTFDLNSDFTVNIQEFAKKNGGIVLANPNAPTGIALNVSEIKQILDMNPEKVVVIDEAYVDFGGESAIPLIDTYPNLVVIQTFSKSRSLAGMRVGFAIGNAELIRGLEIVRDSFNSYTVNCISMNAAIEAINDKAYFETVRNRIIKTRERVKVAFTDMGFHVTNSKANFIFVGHPEKSGEELFLRLREKGILVRHFNKKEIANYLRITIGTDKEMDAVIAAVKYILY